MGCRRWRGRPELDWWVCESEVFEGGQQRLHILDDERATVDSLLYILCISKEE